jgi:hypothetical protein
MLATDFRGPSGNGVDRHGSAYGLLTGRSLDAWTAVFLATTILTSITGFPLEPFGFDPARAIGLISLVLLAAAVVAFYAFHPAGRWRWVATSGQMSEWRASNRKLRRKPSA